MRSPAAMLLLFALPRLALAADEDSSESALIILLLLGLAAVIGGLGSIRDLRRKHMLPPRPRSRRPDDDSASKPNG